MFSLTKFVATSFLKVPKNYIKTPCSIIKPSLNFTPKYYFSQNDPKDSNTPPNVKSYLHTIEELEKEAEKVDLTEETAAFAFESGE